MNTRRLRRTFLELLRINSPSRKEKPVAGYVKAALRDVADECFEDRAGKAIGGNANNLVFRLRGSHRTAPALCSLRTWTQSSRRAASGSAAAAVRQKEGRAGMRKGGRRVARRRHPGRCAPS